MAEKNKSDKAPSIEELQAENAKLREQLAAKEQVDQAVAEKMRNGLTREQAEAVLRHQKKYDESKKKAKG